MSLKYYSTCHTGFVDTVRSLTTPIGQQHLKAEVAHCVAGVLSPLLANIALSRLDEHFAQQWQQAMSSWHQRARRRRSGEANYRLIRYADDFVVVVSGERGHAQRLREQVAAVLAPLGLRLSEEKTRVVHIDEGLDFLGFHIRRMRKRKRTSTTSIPCGT